MPAYGALHSSFKAQPIDELTGTFNALNETTNVRPAKGESISICHGDAITGDGRPMNVWINGSATSFEDSKGFLDVGNCANDAVFGMRQNIGTNSDSYFGDEIHFFTPVASQNGTATFARSFNLVRGDLVMEGEPFQPAAGMNSFGESLNPVLELGGSSGPGGSTFMTGQFEMPVDIPVAKVLDGSSSC